MAGELDRAQALAQQLTDFAQLQQPGRAIGEVLVADVLIAQGDLESAVTLLRGAAAALAPTGYSWGPLALMLLGAGARSAGRDGRGGKGVDARGISARAQVDAVRSGAVRWPGRGRLPRAVTSRRRSRRRERRRSAAERGGQSAVALRALLDAVRLGDMRAADAIARLGAEIDCVFGQLALDYARALTARDAAALRDVSARLDAVGMKRCCRRRCGPGATRLTSPPGKFVLHRVRVRP